MKWNIVASTKQFINESRRILSISYRPTHDEFMRTMKIVLLGVLILGVAGFIIALIIGAIA